MRSKSLLIMPYHKVILHLTLFFSTVIFGYSENPIICNKKSTFVGRITHAQHIAITTAWNNWYYGKGETFFHSWSAGNGYSNSRIHYPNAAAHGSSYSSQSYAPAPMPGKVSENKMRVFTSTEGNTVEARILSINTVNRTARIRTGKGLAYSVPFGRFCESDLSYLKAWWINRNPPRKLSGYKAFLARRKG